MIYSTYDPCDNKLRLYSVGRLDPETYLRVKAAGFKWAPKQELFVAPMWTPERADLLIELCGEIGDEDTSLEERAEQRAERFETYSENRARDAENARQAVSAIADNIPMGQPILVGHHSERHARRDAEKIQNGMRRAVDNWKLSKHWEERASSAIGHAKYKALPGVRARRIKGLEADLRKQEKTRREITAGLALWARLDDPKIVTRNGEPLTRDERALFLADRFGNYGMWSDLREKRITADEAKDRAEKAGAAGIERSDRWIEHLNGRLAYERAMLAADTGHEDPGARWPFAVGGEVLVRREWCLIVRVNKAGGRVTSLTTNRRYVSKVDVSKVSDYRAPADGVAETIQERFKPAPMTNYPEGADATCTAEEWKRAARYSDSARWATVPATEQYGAHRRRSWYRGGQQRYVFVSDEKTKHPPKPTPPREPLPGPVPVPRTTTTPRETNDENGAQFEAMAETLRAGVQVVSVPNLFPTPPELADRMVEMAQIDDGMRILEPSAGTGNIVWAIARVVSLTTSTVHAVEINRGLSSRLAKTFPDVLIWSADWLEWNGFPPVDRVVMNPPFDHGSDIAHILKGRDTLKPGGRLVALCANGPKQNEVLRPLADYWEELPAGTFGVRAVLLTIDAPPLGSQ
jgi:hypothetical protein